MKLRSRLLALLRVVFKGRNYGSIIGKTQPGKNEFYRKVNLQQVGALKFFGVTSLEMHYNPIEWLVWFSDLFELEPNWKTVLRWVREGDNSCRGQ